MTAAQHPGSDGSASPAPAIDPAGHLRLIHHVIRRRGLDRRAGGALTYDDLAQAGALGVMRAAEKFDPAKGSFATYATHWIRQAIQRELANHGAAVRVSVCTQERRRRRGERIRATCLSLDVPIGDPDGASHLDLLADENATAPDAMADRELDDKRRALARIMTRAGLDLRERRILCARVIDGLTFRELAEQHGISRERVRQILDWEILPRLREAAAELGEEWQP